MKKNLSTVTLLIAATSLATLVTPVFARTNACKDDIAKVCSDVDAKDHKAIHDCLSQHPDDVSDACKAQMAKWHGKKKAAAATGDSSSTPPAQPAAAPAQ